MCIPVLEAAGHRVPIIGNTEVKRNICVPLTQNTCKIDAIGMERDMAEMCVQPGGGQGLKGGEETRTNQRRDQGGDGLIKQCRWGDGKHSNGGPAGVEKGKMHIFGK